jgi:transposase
METKDARSLSAEAQEVLRVRAVKAVLGGMNQTETGKLMEVARPTVARWLALYRKRGWRALKAGRRGRPKGAGRLKGWQAAMVVRLITDRTPEQLRMPFVLWTREAVQELIASRCHVCLSVWTVSRYLKRWGFTPQKPVRRAWEQNPKAVEHWLKEEYPAIRQQAKREGGEIHWGDEMGLRSDHQSGRSYGRKGHTPVIPGTGQRFGCNMISTVTNRGTLRFMVFKERFTNQVFIAFLERLIKSAKHKVFLITDGHPVHQARAVTKWLAAHRKAILMFLLPAYSPELNPDEMLNNDVKSNALGRRRPRHQDEMIEDVRGYLRSTQKRPDIVQSYFRAPSVQYAMA